MIQLAVSPGLLLQFGKGSNRGAESSVFGIKNSSPLGFLLQDPGSELDVGTPNSFNTVSSAQVLYIANALLGRDFEVSDEALGFMKLQK